MLVTDCVSDNFEMLVTGLAVFVTLAPTLHRHSKDVVNIEILPSTSTCRQHRCSPLPKGYIDVVVTSFEFQSLNMFFFVEHLKVFGTRIPCENVWIIQE